MHDWYDWTKDIALPTLVGVGSIAVGLIAAVVARQSHNLALQVRSDEAKREEAAARERYRDQVFRVVEPAVAAVIDYTNEVNTAHEVDTAELRQLRSVTSSRLRLLRSVAEGDDRRIALAAWACFRDIANHPWWEVQAYASSGLTVYLSAILEQERDIEAVISRIGTLIDQGMAAFDENEARDRER